jgi:hypothetical protein
MQMQGYLAQYTLVYILILKGHGYLYEGGKFRDHVKSKLIAYNVLSRAENQ